MPPQGVRLGRTPPKASEVTENLGLPAWIGSILDFLGGTPDDTAANAVTPLDLPGAAAVTLFRKAGAKAGEVVPDVAARQAATAARLEDLTEMLRATPDISPEAAQKILAVAERNPRTLAHLGPFHRPGVEFDAIRDMNPGARGILTPSRRGEEFSDMWADQNRRVAYARRAGAPRPFFPQNVRQPGEDVGRIGLMPDRLGLIESLSSNTVPETFAHELTHGAQSLFDPRMAQKYRAEQERLAEGFLEQGLDPWNAANWAYRGNRYEQGAQRAGQNQVRRIMDALEKAIATGENVTVSAPFKVNK